MRRGKESPYRVLLGHLLKDGDEETDLDLRGVLKERVQRSCPLCLQSVPEPGLDGGEFLLEDGVE